MDKAKIPPKSIIDTFSEHIANAVKSHGMAAGCLVTSAIFSEFLAHYKIKHQVVCGYMAMGNTYFTEHVWVEVAYKKAVSEYDVFDDILGNTFRSMFGNTALKRVRDKPNDMTRLQDTKKEIEELRELVEGTKIFKENRKMFYSMLIKRDKNLHKNVWKKIVTELTQYTKTIGFYVDLIQIIYG